MKLCSVLVASFAIGTLGCSSSPFVPQQSLPQDSTRQVDSIGTNPTPDTWVTDAQGFSVKKISSISTNEAAAIEAVKARFKGDNISGVEAELTTLQWAANNLGYAQHLYSLDSPAWVVTVSGTLSGDADNVGTFKLGKIVVAPDNGQLIYVGLFKSSFTPSSVTNWGSRIVKSAQ